MRALALDPTAPATLYVGTSAGTVAKSTDGAANWTIIDTTTTTQSVTQVVPASSTTVYISGFGMGWGVDISTDGGVTWSDPTVDCDSGAHSCGALGFPALALGPGGRLFGGARSGTAAGTTTGVFYSDDGGAHWFSSDLYDSLINDLAIDPSTPTTLYAAARSGWIFKSVDNGATWAGITDGISFPFNARSLAIDPITPSNLWVGGGNAVYQSTDGGATWTSVDGGIAGKFVDSIAIDPATPTTLFAGSNLNPTGSLYKTTDNGATWGLSNVGIEARLIQALVVDPTNPSTVYAGTDSGVYRSDDGGATWASPPPPPPKPPVSSAQYPYAGTDGDPINTFSGELFNTLAADLDLGGPMPLRFVRYYAAFLRRSNVVGDLGSNWRHSFDARLYVVGTAATYVDNRGRSTEFLDTSAGSGTWEQQDNLDTPYQLVTGAGQNAALFDPTDGLIRTFDFTIGGAVTGKLASIEDGHGNVHTVAYDGATGQIVDVSDGLGRTLTFTYNADAIPKIVIVSDGTRAVNFAYVDPNDSEVLTGVTDVRGGSTTYTYADTSATADHGLLLSTTRPRANTPFTQTFDGKGRVASQTDAAGNTVTLAYAGAETTLTDPLGETRVQTHTATGELASRTDQAGDSFTLGSDAEGRRDSLTDRLGATLGWVWETLSGRVASATNSRGNTTTVTRTARSVHGIAMYDLAGITHADGSTESMTYDAAGNLTSHVDRGGNSETFTYDANGQPLTATNTLGGTVTHTYNTDGTRASTTDPATNTTTFGYDAALRPNLITFADSTTVALTYDEADHPLAVTDPNGQTTTFTWDANGNLATDTNPLAATTTYAYDGNDRLSSVISELGGVTSFTYDDLGRIETITDAGGNTTVNGYDARGRRTSVTDPGGNVWSSSYDLEAILASQTDPLGNTTTYASDAMGRLTQTTTALGNVFAVTYDAMGQIVTQTDPLGGVTTITRGSQGFITEISLPGDVTAIALAYDTLGNIVKVTDPNGNDWERAYDTSGRIVSMTDPLGRTQSIAYDSRNRPQTITYPGSLGSATMTYDGVGHPVSLSYSDGTTASYTYDAAGQMIAATGITRGYDADGRIVESNGITFTRDASGRIATMTLAAGKTVTYGYDANDRVTSVTDWIGGTHTLTYDAAGRLTDVARPNGVATVQTWDADSRLLGVSHGAFASVTLTRDANGRITAAARMLPEASSAMGLGSRSDTFDAGAQISGATYDAQGRLTADGAESFTWDLASRLTGYTVGGISVSATYDAGGRRLSRSEGGATRDYVWNDALGTPSIAIERVAAADTRYFICTPDGDLLYSVDAATNARTFYHFDELGNTTAVTDDSGAVVAGYAYTPYGWRVGSTGTLDNPFTWQGRAGVVDEGNGLYYIRARYYDSRTGRFLSRDPSKSIHPHGVHPYAYAWNNPLLLSDHTGRDPVSAVSIADRWGTGYINTGADRPPAEAGAATFSELMEQARRERAMTVVEDKRQAATLHAVKDLEKEITALKHKRDAAMRPGHTRAKGLRFGGHSWLRSLERYDLLKGAETQGPKKGQQTSEEVIKLNAEIQRRQEELNHQKYILEGYEEGRDIDVEGDSAVDELTPIVVL